MRVEEIALRHEIRQMLNEAGFNQKTIKDLVKEVLIEELRKAINQSIHETDYDVQGYIESNVYSIINKAVDRTVKDLITQRVMGDYFNRMKVDVSVEPITNIISDDKEN